MVFSLRTLHKRTVSGIAIVLVITGWFIFNEINSRANKKPPIPVQSEIATRRDVPQTISMSGFVTPQNTVDIRSQVTAAVQSIDVEEGQTIEKGQLLLTLDDRGADANADKLAAQMTKDQALLDEARRTLKRNQELKEKGFIAQSMVDSAQSAVDAALATVNADHAGLTSGRVTVDYYHIVAPLSGRIGEINVHLGSLVQPGMAQPITTITQIDPIEVTFNVPEQHSHLLLTAQHEGVVPVTTEINQNPIEGRLSFVDNAIDSTTGNLKAKALFENHEKKLWPGALVTVHLTLQTLKNVIVISPRSIQVGPDGQFVYLIGDDNKISAQPITVDYLTSEVAVVHGLTAGNHIVMEGGQNLRPDMLVTIVTTEDKKSTNNAAPK